MKGRACTAIGLPDRGWCKPPQTTLSMIM